MKSEVQKYPIYRKYTGINTWFKISGGKDFIEIKGIGERFLVSQVTAKQFPEMLFIQDMINCLEGRWEIFSQDEFERLLKKCNNL